MCSDRRQPEIQKGSPVPSKRFHQKSAPQMESEIFAKADGMPLVSMVHSLVNARTFMLKSKIKPFCCKKRGFLMLLSEFQPLALALPMLKHIKNPCTFQLKCTGILSFSFGSASRPREDVRPFRQFGSKAVATAIRLLIRT